MTAKFYGVGVGPGDAELMTLKAKRVLEEADIICAPKSAVGKESVALSIVEEILGEELNIKDLIFPMTHDQDKLTKFWDQAAEEIKEELEAGLKVAFITIGDPLLYSTYIYVLKRLEGLDFEIETVPGINSYSACAAAMNRPLAEKEETLAIIPAAYECEELAEILSNFDNTVLMKVAPNFDEIVEKLTKAGIKENSFYASRCGQEEEFLTTDFDSLAGEELDYLSMVITKQKFKEE
ncbi:precorrin-2 C(20)-methyltransferase [Fuchsiella alkaliacetigena]|uniref:precorrin-2 C(20)-methyltransferase n=1 Tax=Fuchsiella alkaliacetigena TaxID=957042 RepID=UPI00200B0FCE|nr:precorrin-2 C(20)-methyltransferase [Fuchsiella alkaliacetigena]MCK8825526.1 precorrin-2 C(20)-methyltransferase [Fuchsiella alkaliacetigena]